MKRKSLMNSAMGRRTKQLGAGWAILFCVLAVSQTWSNTNALSLPLTTSVVTDKKGKDKKNKKETQEKVEKEKVAKKSNSATKPAEKKAPVMANSVTSGTTNTTTQNSAASSVTPGASAPMRVVATQPTPTPTPTPVPAPPAQKKTGEENTTSEKAEPGQETADSANTFKFNSSLIAVPVSVIDANGDPVRNLKAEEFALDEEGQKQQVQSLGEPGQTPLELTLLFDISGSVFERFEFQKQAASRFLDQDLKPADSVSVFLVGFEGKLVIPRTRNFAKVKSDLLALQPTKEGTAFYASVVRAAQYLSDNAESGTRRVMVVISDGEDNFSKTIALNDAARELQRSDMVFYSINPSGPSIKLNRISMRGQNAMNTLATDTGGVAFLPDREEDLPRVFRQIAAELQAQYLLGYYSTNEANDGKFRRIKVQLPRHQALRIRARQGYYAPKD